MIGASLIGEAVGNYRVVRKLGEGAVGDVYLAEHPRIGRKVALKVLAPELLGDDEVAARFLVEARTVSELDHQHIVDVFDYGELPGGSIYIAMELLEGRPLSALLTEGPLAVPRALHLVRGILLALIEAHAHGVVHRDLKPDNLFVVPTERDPELVKVLDFGVAKLLHRSAELPHTVTGALMGTPLYMSPEQCRGEPVDERADLYSLCVIFYEMVSGHVPFAAASLAELLLAHTTQAPPPLGLADVAVEKLILRGLEKDAARRWSSARKLLAAVDALDTGTAATLAAPAPLPRPKARRRLWPALLALPFLALAWTVKRQNAAPQPPPPAPPPVVVAPPPVVVAPPPVVVAPPPAVVAAPPAASVRLIVRTLPPGVPLTLDGATLPNPFDGRFPSDGARHKLQAQGAGFVPGERSLSFDHDQVVELRLKRPEKREPATLQEKLVTDYPGSGR